MAITYNIKLYKNDIQIASRYVGSGVQEYDFSALIAETGPGSYACTVQAVGDVRRYRDGPVSEMSDTNVKG